MKFYFNQDKCVNCKKCENVCAYEARTVENKIMKFNGNECRYCGLCISVCPTDALSSDFI